MVEKTIAASDRIDSYVQPWILRARVMCIPFDELGIVPHALVRCDRSLVVAIRDILKKDSEVFKWVIHESAQRMDNFMRALSGPQLLRRLFMRFQTNNSLMYFANAQGLANTKWLGEPLDPHLHENDGGYLERRRWAVRRAEKRSGFWPHAEHQGSILDH